MPNIGPNTGGQTNFQQYQSANGASSQASADRYGMQAKAAAQRAADSLLQQQDKFNAGVLSGTLGAPPRSSGFAGASMNVPATIPSTNVGNGATNVGQVDPTDVQGMMKQAGSGYTGPGSLGDVDGTQAAAQQAQGAEERINALQSPGGIQATIAQGNSLGTAGSDRLSAGLVGSSGADLFAQLRARLHPTQDIDAAQLQSGKIAQDARDLSDKNAMLWQKRTDERSAQDEKDAAWKVQKASDDKVAQDAADVEASKQVPKKSYEELYEKDTPQNRHDFIMQGVDPSNANQVALREKQYADYVRVLNGTLQNHMDEAFNDFNSVMNPGNWFGDAAGIRDPVHDNLQSSYMGGLSLDKGNQGAVNANTGSTNQDAIPWDKVGMNGFFVFTHMTPDDWQVLNSKPQNGANGQIAWIQTRAQQLRSKGTIDGSFKRQPQTNQTGYQSVSDMNMAAMNNMTMAQWVAAGRPDASGQRQDEGA